MYFRGVVLYVIKKVPFIRRWYFHGPGQAYMHRKLGPFHRFFKPGDAVLDIGSGGGLASYALINMGCAVTPLDIHSGAYHESVTPVVYDGQNIPFAPGSFRFGLLLTVLHHIDPSEPVLEGALDTCEEVLIIEDIYRNKLQKYFTFFADRLANFLYSPCPHTNKSDAEWRSTFEAMNADLVHVEYRRFLLFMEQAYYVVRRRRQAA